MSNDVNGLRKQREAFQGMVDALDRVIALAEREDSGEVISDEETNGAIGQLTVAAMTIQSLV